MWLKAFHIIFMVTWFAGLFYLPRLFVYHAMSSDVVSIERFKIMERKLYFGIMTPGMILTLVFGGWMLHEYAWDLYKTSGWLHLKLALIVLLVGYHSWCGICLFKLKHDQNRHSHVFFRWMNEVPVVFLIAIVLLASLKPF
ncbi:protoporphyrinogen oxidase HemJ [Candidatus Methylospira mobilis]|uniref:Protoporphyrinogen IX oxidase n=1 Tax=Candidatus Methylospira mobilis TaxID=1808979 RepID=A0A5Q0BLE6_9GAMM|nr:protoporphyrinogen oxidase HemJ [Candidatus Methylospira mobilis]QFY42586.1 protoporphyrinogen oxidase HemJ [Candidatus Methylospira mobilis]WNV04300.1 protoporphyrinogen oxidase HemJ [Candidatus Methylospira mobilis]